MGGCPLGRRYSLTYINYTLFDGDCLNGMYIPNDEFWDVAMECFNPRNSMMISRNDGMFNNTVNVFKDILITANGLIGLARDSYSDEEMKELKKIKETWQ